MSENTYKVEYIDDKPEETNWLKREGRVHITYSNGDIYEGYINNLKEKHGQGKYIWKKKKDDDDDEYIEIAYYEGEYEHSKRNGIGKMKYPNNDIYHGLWKDNIIHGEGTYIYNNGDIYSGKFNNGIKSGGIGTYEYFNDKSKLIGNWNNGNITQGKWEFIDNMKGSYNGFFEDNKPIGQCIIQFNNGLQQEGEYIKVINNDNDNNTQEQQRIWKGGNISYIKA